MNNKEYELISLEVEYPGIQGGCRWAVATDLSREELFEKYGKELEMYNPLLLITTEQAEAFKDYNRNEEKHKKRAFRCHDPRGYMEGDEKKQRAVVYDGLISMAVDFTMAMVMKTLLQSAFDRLSEVQKRRLLLRYKYELTERQIAEVEGVSHQSVHESIESALDEMKKYVFS